jgi:ADP-ribose pyrophosphatase
MKLLAKKQIFKGRLLNLFLEKQRFPNGYIADLEVIKHPGAVLIVPFLNKDKIILIKQYRPVINAHIWELPAGTLHRGEKPLACAKRELVEEIGYRAKEWKRLGFIYPAPGYTTEKIIVFQATGLEKVSAQVQEDEIISSALLHKKEIIRLFNAGDIVDSKTICALKFAGIL